MGATIPAVIGPAPATGSAAPPGMGTNALFMMPRREMI
jgi:hypothetical protein